VIDQRAHGLPPSADTNVARVAGTLAERAVADLALELFGAEAASYGSFADAHFRMAMTAGVAVGTTEVNLNLVASRVLGLPRAIRFLMDGLGRPDAQSADLMSYLLFDSAYTRALVEIGYRDADKRSGEIEAFLAA